jgi:large conductance mechanosensitive channel
MKDFREFLLRGNLVEVAVGLVIGLAFVALVGSLVADLITPLIAALGGEPNFDALTFTINGSRFRYGAFVNALITFLVIAAVMFFVVVKPVNALRRRRLTEPPVDEATAKCPHCLSEIPAAASRCAFCTQEVAATA